MRGRAAGLTAGTPRAYSIRRFVSREFVTVSDPASACAAHSGFVLRWVLTTAAGIRVQMRRPGVAAAAKVPRLAAPGRSRPALDGHDDAAAEAQLGADKLSVLQQAVTHHDQG